MTKDINLYESGSGGEIAILGDDIVLTEQLYQQVYICLFGGNIEASTVGNEPAGQPRFDWWGNVVNFLNNPAKQFNSQTEAALMNNALNNTGRQNILAAVNADLQYFKSIANITANVVILSTNLVQISVGLTQPTIGQNKTLQFIWDNAKGELIVNKVI